MPDDGITYDEDFKPARICPNLGLTNDPGSYFQFASTWNCCHRPDPVLSLKAEPQTRYCLTEAHVDCPVYQADWDGDFPAAWIARPWERRQERRGVSGRGTMGPGARLRRYGLGLLLIALAVLGMLGIPFARSRLFPGVSPGQGQTVPVVLAETSTPTEAPTSTEPPPPTVIASASPTITPNPTLTPTPIPTDTPLPTPGPGLGTPFGPEGGFLIHVVEAGESFASIASQFDTTVDVLTAANPIVEGASLWVGRQLVVPIGRTDPAGVPPFIVLFTTQPVSLQNIAAVNRSDPGQIRFYNQLGESDWIPSGRWLIIPIVTE